MAKQRSSFAKLQRDKAKKERAAEKRAARRAKNSTAGDEQVVEETTEDQLIPTGDGVLSAPELLSLIEKLHMKRATGAISEEEFEDAKIELLVRLPS